VKKEESMILILSGPGDDHARRVQAELERRGISVGRLDPDQFSALSGVEVSLTGTGLLEGSVGANGAPVQVEHVRAVYCGESGNSDSNPYLDELWDVLDIGVVPGMPAIVERSRDSERQAHIAASVGFDLRSESDELPTRLRIVVVGYRVFAAALSSGEALSRNLWERCVDRDGISPAVLPVVLAERCRDMVEQMGLEFATLDIAVGTDGAAVFCGLNPFGHFACIEDATGLPITRAVADLLLTEAAGGARSAAPVISHPSRTPRQIPFLRVARGRQ
jgi:hypothetical protein